MQLGALHAAVHASVSSALPSSHCSSPSTIPSPHTAPPVELPLAVPVGVTYSVRNAGGTPVSWLLMSAPAPFEDTRRTDTFFTGEQLEATAPPVALPLAVVSVPVVLAPPLLAIVSVPVVLASVVLASPLLASAVLASPVLAVPLLAVLLLAFVPPVVPVPVGAPVPSVEVGVPVAASLVGKLVPGSELAPEVAPEKRVVSGAALLQAVSRPSQAKRRGVRTPGGYQNSELWRAAPCPAAQAPGVPVGGVQPPYARPGPSD